MDNPTVTLCMTPPLPPLLIALPPPPPLAVMPLLPMVTVPVLVLVVLAPLLPLMVRLVVLVVAAKKAEIFLCCLPSPLPDTGRPRLRPARGLAPTLPTNADAIPPNPGSRGDHRRNAHHTDHLTTIL
jgi:hypothetical protein